MLVALKGYWLMVKLCNICQHNLNNTDGWYARCDLFGRLKVVDRCESFWSRKDNVVKENKVVKKYDALAWTGVR